jgi:hypothetical protein
MTTPVISKRTYKRELALAVFVWLVYLSVYSIEALTVVVFPAFSYIGLALGLDWWGKTGPAKVNTQDEGQG